MYLCLSIDNMYQGRALPISPTQSNTMIDNNGCHPLRACNALRVLYDGSIRRGVLNLFYMKNSISIHEWRDGSEKGARISFYRDSFCYAAYEVSLQKAHAFFVRALRKGIVLPF